MVAAPDLPVHGAQSVADRLQISRIMIIQARQELIDGSRLQAGEKAWGAVVQPVKAIAQQRGWKHESHQDIHSVMSQIALEYGFDGEQIWALSLAYFVGHENFYENFRSPEELSEMMDRVEEMLPGLIDVTTMPPRTVHHHQQHAVETAAPTDRQRKPADRRHVRRGILTESRLDRRERGLAR